MDNDKKLNDEVTAWRIKTTAKLKESIVTAGITHKEYERKRPSSKPSPESRKSSSAALKSSQRQKFGVVSSVRFSFPRNLVFVEKGVSRGHPITNPRTAKPWFNKIVEREIEALADIVAENSADKVVTDSFERMKIR